MLLLHGVDFFFKPLPYICTCKTEEFSDNKPRNSSDKKIRDPCN